MRFLCRIGLHDWGRWSNYWASTVSDGGRVEGYKVFRSRKCKCCGWERNKNVAFYTSISNRFNNPAPVWESER